MGLEHNKGLTSLKWVYENYSLHALSSSPTSSGVNPLYHPPHRLDFNELGVKGGAAIGKSLRHNEALTELM
jgi:hypothetical protein